MAVTEISFGGAAIGNLFTAVTDDDARAAVDAAWDGGIRFFDTAPHYGLGLSERLLGAGWGDRPRGQYVISTKVGRLLEARHRSAAPRGRDAEGFDVPRRPGQAVRLQRRRRPPEPGGEPGPTGLDRVDVARIHDPDAHGEEPREAYPALARLRAEGVVRRSASA